MLKIYWGSTTNSCE